jgi:hypothetical protein
MLFRKQFPLFQLGDELLHDEGRDVIWSMAYTRRRRARDGRRVAERAAEREGRAQQQQPRSPRPKRAGLILAARRD